MAKQLKTAQSEISLKADALSAEHFQTDPNGNLLIKNADLAHLIESNVPQNLKGKATSDAISVGIIVRIAAQ